MVLASGLALTAGEEPRYTIVDLGALGPSITHAYSINKWSQVVGESNGRAFLVTPEYDIDGNPVWFRDNNPEDGINDLMIDLGTLGGSGSVALGINDLGQVVGRAWTADIIPTHYAFMIVPEDTDGDGVPDTWFRDGDGDGANDLMISLGNLGSVGGRCSIARGISNSGYVVGYLGGANTVGGEAFIIVPEDTDGDDVPDTWFRDGDGDGANDLMIKLTPSGGAEAYGVNDSGQVVGWSSETSNLAGRAFLVTPADVDGDGDLDWFADTDGDEINDLMIELGPFPGDTGCRAKAINSISSSGKVQVVGSSWFMRSTVSSGYHGVRWEVDELGNVTLTDLGKVAPTDINDAGQVVGTWGSGSPKRRHYTALLWENGTMTELIDLLANSEGIGDLTAGGINESGEIVGTISGDGYQHAYIAVPSAQEPPPLEITTTSLPDAVLGEPYSATLEATGGTPPYTWSIIDGSLPGGLSLDPLTGVISGTPSSTGTWDFMVQVMDDLGDTATQPLSITVGTAPVVDVTVVSVTARDIRYGGKYNITATVRNDGLDGVTVHVDCGVEGDSGNQTLSTREVTIAPGESANVKFNDKSTLGKGEYTATVTVQEDPDVGTNNSDTFQIK